MRLAYPFFVLATLLSLFLVSSLGCKNDKAEAVKAPEKVADTSETNTVAEEQAKEPAGPEKKEDKYDKIQKDDMYLERARKTIKPENLESEIRRLEREVDKFEAKLEQQEALLEASENQEEK